MLNSLVQMYQVGTFVLNFPNKHAVSEELPGEHVRLLSSDSILFPNVVNSNPRTITIEGTLHSSPSFTQDYLMSMIASQTRKIVPIISFIDIELLPVDQTETHTLQDSNRSDMPLLWLESRGRVSAYTVEETEGQMLRVSITVQMDAYWKPLNRFKWVYAAAPYVEPYSIPYVYDYDFPAVISYLETNVDTYYSLYRSVAPASDNSLLAQSFQVDAIVKIDRVRLYLRKVGTPGGNLSVSIQSSSGPNPSGVDLAASASTVVANSLGASAGWVEFEVAPLYVVSGATYWVVLTSDVGSYSASDYVEMGVDASSPAYADGQFYRYSATSVWTGITADAAFQIYAVDPRPSIEEPAALVEYLETNADDEFDLRGDLAYEYLAQSFTIAANADMQEVQLHMRRVATFTYGVYVTIHPDLAGDPDLTIELGRSRTLVHADFSTSAEWESFLFDSLIALKTGQTYWIVATGIFPIDIAACARWSADTSAPSYADGLAKGYDGTWNTLGADFIFRVIPHYFRTYNEHRDAYLESVLQPAMRWIDIKHVKVHGMFWVQRGIDNTDREWSIDYQAGLWPFLCEGLSLDYPALGQEGTLNFISPTEMVYIDPRLFTAPALSYYRILLDEMVAGESVTLTVTLNDGTQESYIFDFDTIDDLLDDLGYTGILAGDMLFFGAVHLQPCFIVRGTEILDDVYVPLTYSGDFPGILKSGYNRLELTAPTAVNLRYMHLFRRNV